MTFSEHFKRVRKHSKMTQKEIADRLCISPQSVSKWESGESLPTIEHLPKLAEIFSCSVNVFFSEYELELYEQFVTLSDTELVDLLLRRPPSDKGDDIYGDERDYPLESLFLPALKQYLTTEDKISPARLQKQLGVGYAVAANMVDALNKLGVITREAQGYHIDKDKLPLLDAYLH